MSNLRLINETSGTSVSSVDITDVFTSDFDIYKISGVGNFSNTNRFIHFRFINSSGSVVSASNYDYANLVMESYTSFGESRSTNADHIERLVYSTNGDDFGFEIYVFNPNNSNSYTFALYQSSGRSSLGLVSVKSIAVLKQQAQMGGIKIYNADFTDISVRTYGLRVDS